MFSSKTDEANYTKAILLLTLTIMGNFMSETLTCSTQKLLSENRIVKQIVILFLIYFTLNITNNDIIHPIEKIKMALIIWLFFLIFTKMSLTHVIIVFLVICLHYILDNFRDYYRANNIDEYDDIIYFTNKLLIGIIILTSAHGLITYIFKKRMKYKNFSWYTFFAGVNKCK